jgi:AAA15 family ATPase/GTPase
MIHSYKFRNFFSFADWAEVSFVVNKKVPESHLVFTSPAGVRLSKLMTVIGANGSGKTNVLKPLPFLSWFITRSFSSLKPDDDIPVEPHFFSGSDQCEFELEFEVLGEIYRYALVTTKKRVFEETLYIKSKKFFSYLFKREWNEAEKKYDVAQQKFGFIKSEAEKVRSNASLISTAAQYDVSCAKELVSYFQTFEYTVNYGGRTPFIPNDIFDASENFSANPELKKQMVKLLCSLDLGISDLIIEKRKVTDESGEEFEMYMPFGVHKSGSKTHKLHLIYESSGTQRAFVLLDKFLPLFDPGFKSGGLAVIDEMESDLHPDMLRPLLDLFIDPETNPNNSQIVFTCHAHEVLDIVDKAQVQIVEKNEAGESEVWRLDDIKGVRRDENIYAKYRAGTYGGVPNI